MSAETADGCRDDDEAEEEDAGEADHHHLGLQAGPAAQAGHEQTAESESSESRGGETSGSVDLDLQ